MPAYGGWWQKPRDREVVDWRPLRKPRPRIFPLLLVLALCCGLSYFEGRVGTRAYYSQDALVAGVTGGIPHGGKGSGAGVGSAREVSESSSSGPRRLSPAVRKKHARASPNSPLARSDRTCRTRKATVRAQRLRASACVRNRTSGLLRARHAVFRGPRGGSASKRAR